MDSVATSVSALAGLLSAVAGLVTAFRRDKPAEPAPPPRAEPEPARPRRAGPLVSGNWTAAGYGVLALLLAFVLVLAGSAPESRPLIWLRLAVAVPFTLATYFGVSDLYRAVQKRDQDLLISSGTGLTAAAGALTAMVIAGSYESADL